MSDSDRKGSAMILVVLLVFGALAILALTLNKRGNGYDVETFCPLDENYLVTHFIIDKTDPWSTQQKERIKKIIIRTKSNLQLHERLKIHLLDKNGLQADSPAFDLCNPGRGEQASPIYENPRQIQQRFDSKFSEPLEIILNRLLEPGVAPSSPLITSVNIFADSVHQQKLILVSDLMENEGTISFYDAIPRYKDWAKSSSSILSSFGYSHIEVHYIDRKIIKSRTKDRVKTFWKTHLNNMGQKVTWNTL